jgi:hypothetical protein
MTGEVSVVVSFLIYLSFFGWLGWWRGARRELIVFIVAVLSWIVLYERGDMVVSIANLGRAGINFAQAGGFGGSQQDAFAALTGASPWITAEGREPFLFVLWAAILVITYLLTGWLVDRKFSRQNGWAVLLGMLNGLIFAIAFLPSLTTIFSPTETTFTAGSGYGLFNVFRAGFQLLWEGITSLLAAIFTLGPMALLVLVTLLLVLAATSIRGTKARES